MHANSPATTSGKSGKRGRGGTAQVVAVKAQKGSIKIYFTGLGAVTPIYTVTVKSRVDGELVKVLFKEGQTAQQGELLAEIDPRPFEVQLEQAEGQLARDQSLLKNAQADNERYRILFRQGIISQQQMVTQDALVNQYQGTIKSDEAQIHNAKLNLTYCHITAPITGLIGLRLMDPGNIVHAADSTGLLVITQLDPISVIFSTSEDQLPALREKLRAGKKLSVAAWDRELKNELGVGTLETIDNQIDQTTGTLKLRAVFENAKGRLFPSQFVNARLLIEHKQGVTILPNAGVQRNSQGTYVWLVKDDQTVTVSPVTVGASEGDQSEITSGIEPGQSVVIVGVDRLEEGSKVSTRASGDKDRKSKGGKKPEKADGV
jgi:multidrug efflux system membrane fusion protein